MYPARAEYRPRPAHGASAQTAARFFRRVSSRQWYPPPTARPHHPDKTALLVSPPWQTAPFLFFRSVVFRSVVFRSVVFRSVSALPFCRENRIRTGSILLYYSIPRQNCTANSDSCEMNCASCVLPYGDFSAAAPYRVYRRVSHLPQNIVSLAMQRGRSCGRPFRWRLLLRAQLSTYFSFLVDNWAILAYNRSADRPAKAAIQGKTQASFGPVRQRGHRKTRLCFLYFFEAARKGANADVNKRAPSGASGRKPRRAAFGRGAGAADGRFPHGGMEGHARAAGAGARDRGRAE